MRRGRAAERAAAIVFVTDENRRVIGVAPEEDTNEFQGALMTRLGRYTVLRKLATGDYAEVFACESDGSTVAVKLFRPKSAALDRFMSRTPGATIDRLRQRFRDEAALMAKFSHPNIVPVLEIGALDPDTPFYVMPYLPASLASEIAQPAPPGRDPAAPLRGPSPRPLATEAAVRRLREILAGLGAVHEMGVVHRDLKLRNILVGADGVAALTDFGVAKAPWPGYTPLRSEFATPPFVSPEQQADAGSVDARSDVFSVGAVAYVLLTGCFPSGNLPPERLNPRVETPLSDWVMAAMCQDRDKRPRDADALLRLLDDAVQRIS